MARAQGLGGKDGPAMDLSPRKDQILASVVSGFIQSGEPVGSKAVAQEVGVSSATVRNEMASLTELGFLEQPHTSAGRVPSQRGYREYVDRLMPEPRLDPAQQRWIDSHLGPYDPDQLLALAAGAETTKLKYGHRGANQPVRCVKTGRSYITSQNHGYAVLSEGLDKVGGVLSYVNLNDNTCEGIDYPDLGAFSMQFHPEAHGGPRDMESAFDRFMKMMEVEA